MSDDFNTYPDPVCGALIRAIGAKMVTIQKSRGRTVVIDKKTGKPKAKSARMSVPQRIRQKNSKRVKVSKRTLGSQRP